MKPYLQWMALVLVFLSWIHCAPTPALDKDPVSRMDVRKLALDMDRTLQKPVLRNQQSVVLSPVSLSDFTLSDSVALYVQQQLSHHLFRLGYRVLDIRVAGDVLFQPRGGEFILSRQGQLLRKQGLSGVKSVIIGTYTVMNRRLVFNISMIELESGLIRASGRLTVTPPLPGTDIRDTTETPPVLERPRIMK